MDQMRRSATFCERRCVASGPRGDANPRRRRTDAYRGTVERRSSLENHPYPRRRFLGHALAACALPCLAGASRRAPRGQGVRLAVRGPFPQPDLRLVRSCCRGWDIRASSSARSTWTGRPIRSVSSSRYGRLSERDRRVDPASGPRPGKSRLGDRAGQEAPGAGSAARRHGGHRSPHLRPCRFDQGTDAGSRTDCSSKASSSWRRTSAGRA